MADKADASIEADGQLLTKLWRGAEKAFQNAESLFKEACVLRGAGFLCRALFLHQISMEECAKIEIVGAHATELLMSGKFDPVKLRKGIVSHTSKNRANAYFLRVSDEERAAQAAGDTKTACRIFSEMQDKFHLGANAAKNASLYVDFKDNEFVAPDEAITEAMVASIAKLNEEYLELSAPKIRLLGRFAASPELFAAGLIDFDKLVRTLESDQRHGPREAVETLLAELYQRMLRQT